MVLTGMPRLVLGESCTTAIKDFAIFPPRQKQKKTITSTKVIQIYFLWKSWKLFFISFTLKKMVLGQ